MPRKNAQRRRVVTPPESEPSLPDVAPAPRPAALQASTSQDSFDPGDVPGNDEGAHGDSGPDIRVNDPDAVPVRKGGALDVKFFFDKTGARAICKECR